MEEIMQLNGDRPEQKKNGECRTWSWRPSVEPVMFLYMMAFMLTTVLEEAFFINKACLVNMRFPANVCQHIEQPQHKAYKTEVQIIVSNFHQYDSIAQHSVPIVLAFFLGAWSDKYGRKLPLLLGLLGGFIYSSMVVLNTLQDNWPLEAVLYTASFPSAFTGSSLAVFMSAFSYIADITRPEERTLRVTFLEVVYLIPMPTGVALGSYLFSNVFNKSYTIMFSINASLIFASMVYAWFALKWQTVRTGQSVANVGVCTMLMDFFDMQHAIDSIQTLVKKRPNRRRLCLILIIAAMALYTFQRDEKHMIYLYMQLKFHWGVEEFSKFRISQTTAFITGLLFGVPCLTKLLGLQDTTAVMIGTVAHMSARLLYANADVTWIFYLGAGLSSLGPIVAPILRSLTSKLVPPSERGKVFAVLTVADTAVPLLSGMVYTQVYNATIQTAPETIFYVTALSQLIVFLIGLTIHMILGGTGIRQALDAETISV